MSIKELARVVLPEKYQLLEFLLDDIKGEKMKSESEKHHFEGLN
jgi:hypothetical protein